MSLSDYLDFQGRINCCNDNLDASGAIWAGAWQHQSSTHTSSETDPDGGTTAFKVKDGADVVSLLPHYLTGTLRLGDWGNWQLPLRISVIAKAAGRERIYFGIGNLFGAGAYVGFDLVNIAVFDTNAGTDGWSIIDSSISSIASPQPNWVLCTMDLLPPSGTWVSSPRLYLDGGTGSDPDTRVYVGDASSGVYLWHIHILPSGAWDITTQTVHDDFDDLSNIDLDNTRQPGFKWYVHNAWPAYAEPILGRGFLYGIQAFGATPADGFSISSPSILKISKGIGNTNTSMTSCCPHPDDPHKILGKTIRAPYLGFCKLAYDPIIYSELARPWGLPAWWLYSREGFTGGFRYCENDMMEATSGTYDPVTPNYDSSALFDQMSGLLPGGSFGGSPGTDWWYTGGLIAGAPTRSNRQPANDTDFQELAVLMTGGKVSPSTNNLGVRIMFVDGLMTPDSAIVFDPNADWDPPVILPPGDNHAADVALCGTSTGMGAALLERDMVMILGLGGKLPADDLTVSPWPLFIDYVTFYEGNTSESDVDNFNFTNSQSGFVGAADSAGGALHQRAKITIGPAGDSAIDISRSNSFPIVQDSFTTCLKIDANSTDAVIGITQRQDVTAMPPGIYASTSGALLRSITIIPSNTSPGAVSIKDGSGPAIIIFSGGPGSVADLTPFEVRLNATSVDGGWTITTGADVSALAEGYFY